MADKPTPRPTDAELAILRVLWQRGPSTVREVHDALSSSQETGYTTVLKLLQIMTDKGLVVRDESQRAHVYSSSESEQRTQRKLIGDLSWTARSAARRRSWSCRRCRPAKRALTN